MSPNEALVLCTAYESGVGHGLKDDHFREQFVRGTNEALFYRIGWGKGKDMRNNQDREEMPRFIKE